jgi:hypothetical protein
MGLTEIADQEWNTEDGMGFLRNLFGRRPVDERNTTDAQLNVILVPLRDRICDFKDETKISWTVILPAIQKISTRLFVQCRGLESMRALYTALLEEMDRVQKIPPGSIVSMNTPSSPSEHVARVNSLVWNIANDLVARGHPVEHVAQALAAFVTLSAEKIVDEMCASWLLVETYRELQSDSFER